MRYLAPLIGTLTCAALFAAVAIVMGDSVSYLGPGAVGWVCAVALAIGLVIEAN